MQEGILYISYDGMTDPLGQSQVLPYLQGLSQKGWKIYLISFEKSELFKEKEKIIHELTRQAGIEWFPLIYHKSPAVFSTLWDIYKMISLGKKIASEGKVSIIHCRSYISSIAGLHLQNKFNLKFIFDMRGFWADERVDGKIWDRQNPFYNLIFKYFKKKERSFFIESDHIISLTETGKKEILNWGLNIPGEKVSVIPCCADLEHFKRTEQHILEGKAFRESAGIGDELVVSYLGSTGTWYMLPEMLQFFKLLVVKKPGSRFLVITHDDPKPILQMADREGLRKDDLIITKADRSTLPGVLTASDLSLFFIKPVFSKKASSPTKMGELLGLGIPLIANSGVGDVAEIIETTGSGILIKDFNKICYLEAIEKIAELLNLPAEKFRSAGLSYFSLQKGIETYDAVYRKVGSPKPEVRSKNVEIPPEMVG